MNEWFTKTFTRIKGLWSKWTQTQRIILVAVIIASIVGLGFLFTFNISPSQVPIINRPITNEVELNRITNRLEAEGFQFSVGTDGRLFAQNRAQALEARSILVREDLLPTGTDPWQLFDIDRWTITDFERNVNLRRAITSQIQQHITALSDVDSATVTLVIPDRALFAEDQDPTTASVTIIPRPGSDIRENRRKIEGLEKLIQFAVPGLHSQNITITDETGTILNNFVALQDFDRLEISRRELELKRTLERQYKNAIRAALSQIFTPRRVEIPNIEVTLDMGNRTIEREEFFPIITVQDNPLTPFDETEFVLSITRSTETFFEDYQGTGFNPQGPPGQEGQTPPAYRDLEGIVGSYRRENTVTNNEINRTLTSEQGSPSIQRISVSVALDGVWVWEYDDNGRVIQNPDGSIRRTYVPIAPDQLAAAQELVESAVGFSRVRGDLVTVRNIQFDRSSEHRAEDLDFQRQQNLQTILLWVVVSLASLLALFIVFRLITREIERRRRLREEELARQHQAMREAALRSAEEESAEVEMSVEERARLEMQENAINIAREHPEDVAQLIRSWLLEE
jgi:flagellar M-ring protein FliF